MSGVRSIGTPYRLPSSAASNNAAIVRTRPCRVLGVHAYNSNAAVRYLKLYDKATLPVPGTDTPLIVIALPPTTVVTVPIEAQEFFSGVGIGLVTGALDNDNTGVGAGEVLSVNIFLDKND